MKLAFSSIILCLALAACAPAPTTGEPSDARTWSGQALQDLRGVAASAPAEGLPNEAAALAELSRFEAASAGPYRGDQVDVAADALFEFVGALFCTGRDQPCPRRSHMGHRHASAAQSRGSS